MPRSGFLCNKRNDGKQYAAKTEVSKKLSNRGISKQASATLTHNAVHETRKIFSNVSTRSATSSISASARSVTSTSRQTFSKIVPKKILSPKNNLKDIVSQQASRGGKKWQEERSDVSSTRGMRRQKRVYYVNDDDSDESSRDERGYFRESGLVLMAKNESTLHAPIPRRLNSSSPPLELFDKIINPNQKKILPWKRSLPSQAPPTGQVRAPYMSKKQKANLSLSLRTTSAGNIKSAWERSGSGASSLHSGGGLILSIDAPAFNGDRLYDSLALDDDSFSQTSHNAILHPAISPAYKFIPIGFSFESDCENESFCSDDYDICNAVNPSSNSEYECPSSRASQYDSNKINEDKKGNRAILQDSASNSFDGEEINSSPETVVPSTASFDDREMTSFEKDTLKCSIQCHPSQGSLSNKDQCASMEIEEMSSFEKDNLNRLNELLQIKEVNSPFVEKCSSSVAETATTQESDQESLAEVLNNEDKQNRGIQTDGYQWLYPIIQLASAFSINCGGNSEP
ncbi:hypothetical protein ACHAXS_003988 [Conticribra weissflogii]